MLSSECCTFGTMRTLLTGLHSLWWSLFTVVALAWLPKDPSKVAVDQIPVAIVGSDSLKALSVAPVLQMADGMSDRKEKNQKPQKKQKIIELTG